MEPPSALFLSVLYLIQENTLDTGDLITGSIVLVLLLFLSALFSGSEVALFTLDSSQKEELKMGEDAASKRVSKLLAHPRSVLVSILILNTMVNVGAAITAAVLTHAVATANSWSPVATVVIEVIVLTFIILVVSEITPKLIAARQPVNFTKRISWLLLLLHQMLQPLSSMLARAMQAFHGRFSGFEEKISSEDLKTMAEIGAAHGTIEEGEREMIHSIVDFGDTSVREIMISRLDIIALDVGANIADAIEIIRRSGHSRLPLYVEHLDNILGIIYAKDLLRVLTENPDEETIDWTRLARPAIFVPLGKMLDDLLRDFQERKTHIALVVDEYGGTAGLVTLEDVLEEIVGEIRDEHDEDEEELYEKISATEYLVDAKIDLDDLNELLGTKTDTGKLDFETLGGLIFDLAREIPAEGDTFENAGISYEVTEVINHRVVEVRIKIGTARPNF